MGLPKVAVPKYSLKLPSTDKEIQYRPFLVKEEKLLLIAMESDDEKQVVEATKDVIKNCIVGDVDVDSLPIFDIEYIFLWLRARSKGEVIELKYKCPKCEKTIPVSFNVEDVKVTKNNQHTTKIQLTDELGVCLRYPDMNLQNKIDSISKDNQIEIILKSILLCIDYIYDNENIYARKDHTEKELEEFLESLSDTQFQKISTFFETMPRLKHEVKLECLNRIEEKQEGKKKESKKKEKKVCGYTEDLVLEGLQSFFE